MLRAGSSTVLSATGARDRFTTYIILQSTGNVKSQKIPDKMAQNRLARRRLMLAASICGSCVNGLRHDESVYLLAAEQQNAFR